MSDENTKVFGPRGQTFESFLREIGILEECEEKVRRGETSWEQPKQLEKTDKEE